MNLVTLQQSIAATGTAQNLPNNPVQHSITIHAPSTNTASVALGNSSAVTSTTGFLLEKGNSVTIDLTGGNTNQVWAVGSAGDTFSVIGA
jgi:hypothetical protein